MAEPTENDSSARSITAIASTNTTEATTKATAVTMIYVVSYTLRPRRLVQPLIEILQEYPSWWHHLDDTWLIGTSDTATDIYNRIAPHITEDDSVLVMKFQGGDEFAGWLPAEAFEWIRSQNTPPRQVYNSQSPIDRCFLCR